MTHSEFVHWVPCVEGIPRSCCPGEMRRMAMLSREGATNDPWASALEIWVCCCCDYTLHVARDARGVRRVMQGIAPDPSLQPTPGAGSFDTFA